MKKYNRSLKLYVVVALSKFNMNKPNYKKKFNSFTAEKHSKSLRSSLCGGAGSLSPINITQCICRRTGSPFRLTNSFPLLGLCQVVNICFLWFLIGFYYAQPKVSCLIYLWLLCLCRVSCRIFNFVRFCFMVPGHPKQPSRSLERVETWRGVSIRFILFFFFSNPKSADRSVFCHLQYSVKIYIISLLSNSMGVWIIF